MSVVHVSGWLNCSVFVIQLHSSHFNRKETNFSTNSFIPAAVSAAVKHGHPQPLGSPFNRKWTDVVQQDISCNCCNVSFKTLLHVLVKLSLSLKTGNIVINLSFIVCVFCQILSKSSPPLLSYITIKHLMTWHRFPSPSSSPDVLVLLLLCPEPSGLPAAFCPSSVSGRAAGSFTQVTASDSDWKALMESSCPCFFFFLSPPCWEFFDSNVRVLRCHDNRHKSAT